MENYKKLKLSTLPKTQVSSIEYESNHMPKSNKDKKPSWIAPSTNPYKTQKRDYLNKEDNVDSKIRRLKTLLDDTSTSMSDTSSNVDFVTKNTYFSKQIIKKLDSEDLADSLKNLSNTVERPRLLQPFSREDDIKIIMYFHKHLHLLALKNKNLIYKQLEMKYCFEKSPDFLRRRFMDEILPNLYHYDCLSLEDIIVFYDKADMVVPKQVRNIIRQKMLTTTGIDITTPNSSEIEGTTLFRSQKLLRENNNTAVVVHNLKSNHEKNTIRKKILINTENLLKNCEISKENKMTKSQHMRLNEHLDTIPRNEAKTQQSKEIISNKLSTISETMQNNKSHETSKIGSNVNSKKNTKHLEVSNDHSVNKRFKSTKISDELKVASNLVTSTGVITVDIHGKKIREKELSDDGFSDDTILLEADISGKKSTINIADNIRKGQISNKKTFVDGSTNTEKPTMKNKTTQLHYLGSNKIIDILCTESDLVILKTTGVTHIFIVKENANYDMKQMEDQYQTLESNVHFIDPKVFEILKKCAKYKKVIETACITITATAITESATNQNKSEPYNLRKFIKSRRNDTINYLNKILQDELKILDYMTKDIGIKELQKKYHSQIENQREIFDTVSKQTQENATQTMNTKDSENIESINYKSYHDQTISEGVVGENIELINNKSYTDQITSEEVVAENIPPDINITNAEHNYDKRDYTELQSSTPIKQTQPPLTERLNAEKMNETIVNVKQINSYKINSPLDGTRNSQNNQTKSASDNKAVQQTNVPFKNVNSLANFIGEMNKHVIEMQTESVISSSGRNNTDQTDSSHINVCNEEAIWHAYEPAMQEHEEFIYPSYKTVQTPALNPIVESPVSKESFGTLRFIKPKYTYSRKPKPPVSVEENILESPDASVHIIPSQLNLAFYCAQPSTSKSNDFIYAYKNSANEFLDVPSSTDIKDEQMDLNIPEPIFETIEDNDTKVNLSPNSFSTTSETGSVWNQINYAISNLESSSLVIDVNSTGKNDSKRNSESKEDTMDSQNIEEIKQEPLNNSIHIKQEWIGEDDSNDTYSEMIFDRAIIKQEISILESISNEIVVPNQIFPIAMSRRMKAHVEENRSNINHLKPILERDDANEVIKEESHKN